VPVGVPVTGQEGLQLLYTHPQFQGMMAAPYAHHYPHYQVVAANQQQYHDQEVEEELDREVKGEQGEHQIISPESGISSASPLSWQQDQSPSLIANSAQFTNADQHQSPPLVNHVNESLSGWERRSPTSSSPSSRTSPTLEEEEEREDSKGSVEESTLTTISQDSGVASAETSTVEMKEKFNLGEIINFVSSSWDKVNHDLSHDTSVRRHVAA